ncbi:MAG: hypothetical protein ABUS47_15375 [Steroidobacter sp.]
MFKINIGYILIAVGLIDFAVKIYCFFKDLTLAVSGFGVFAIASGIYVLKVGERSFTLLRYGFGFMVPNFVVMLVLFLLKQPSSLIYAQIRLEPFAFFGLFAIQVLLILFSVWLARWLGRFESKEKKVAVCGLAEVSMSL